MPTNLFTIAILGLVEEVLDQIVLVIKFPQGIYHHRFFQGFLFHIFISACVTGSHKLAYLAKRTEEEQRFE